MTQLTTEQLQLLQNWDTSKKSLEAAKESEMNFRNMVTHEFFPDAKEGTQRVELPAGYALKLVAKTNYTFDDKEAMHGALCEIETTGEHGAFIAQRLVSFTPKLSVAEYKKLSPQYKVIIDRVLTSKPAAPALEIEEPKVKK